VDVTGEVRLEEPKKKRKCLKPVERHFDLGAKEPPKRPACRSMSTALYPVQGKITPIPETKKP